MAVVAIIAVLAAIAIPAFARYQLHTKQSEAKAALRAFYLNQRAYYGEHNAYGTMANTVGFAMEGANRYFYRFDSPCSALWNLPGPAPATGYNCITQNTARFPGPRLLPAWTATLGVNGPLTPGIGGTCPACQFTAAAVGDLDNDPVLDVWFVTSVDGTVPPGPCVDDTLITAGLPHNFVDDGVCQ